MLFITGLLTLLAIAHAEGDYIKGGSRIKGGSVSQEKVAQEDIIPSPFNFNLKTGVSYGTKVTRDESGGVDRRVKGSSKTVHSSSLPHAVKTVDDITGKLHLSSGVHHAAASPVVQDEVSIEDPASLSGIKTLKTPASVKTRLSQQDTPVVHHVVQTQKITHDPDGDSIKTVKTLKTAVAGKTRFAQEDTQVRDPQARSVVQILADPLTDTVKTTKTLKTVSTGKTRFSPDDTQDRDPVVQTIKTVGDSLTPIISKQVVKTAAKTAQSSSPRTKMTVKTSQETIDSQRDSSVPESIVSAARRNTITATQATRGTRIRTSAAVDRNSRLGSGRIGNANDGVGLTLDEVTLRALQDAGGVVIENGEISVNEIGLEMLKNTRGGSVLQRAPGFVSADEGTPVSLHTETSAPRKPVLTSSTPQTGEFGLRQGVRSQIRRVSTGSRQTASTVGTRSGGDQTLRSSIGGVRTSIIRGPQSPIMLQPDELSGIGGLMTDNSPIQRPGQLIRQRQRGPSRTFSGLRSEISTRVSTEAVRHGSRLPGSSLTTTNLKDNSKVLGLGEEFGTRRSTDIRQPTITANTGSVFFNGKEINISGLKEGQLFDENLQPISGIQNDAGDAALQGTTGLISGQTSRSRRPKPVGTYGSGTLSVTRNQQQTATVQKEKMKFRRPVASPVTLSGQFLGSPGQQITDSGTVLFKGKEINVRGLNEGQLFDENLQPILPGSFQSTDINTLTIPQSVNPVSHTVTRNQQQTVRIRTESARVRSPVSTAVIAGQSVRGSDTFNLRSQGISSFAGVPKPAQDTSNKILETRVLGGQTMATRSETVLFNGKEINIGGLGEGQLFDENLQPILSGITDSVEKDFKVPTILQPATRTTIRRQQSVVIPKEKVIMRAPASPVTHSGQPAVETTGDIQFNLGSQGISGGSGPLRPIQTKPVSIQKSSQEVTAYNQSIRSSGQRQSIIQGSGLYGSLVRSRGTAGIRGQTTAARTETVLFNGKEINISGLGEGQLFDENLQPILPGITDSVEKNLKAPTILQPATRTTIRRQQSVVIPKEKVILRSPITRSGQSAVETTRDIKFNLDSQGISGNSGVLRPIHTKPVTRQRRPQEATAYGQGNRSSGQRQSNIQGSGLSGGLVVSSETAAIRGQTTAVRTGTVLFNGKEINISGLREGQLFDENLQPISPGSRNINKVDLKASALSQNAKPDRRTVVRNRPQSVSSLDGAPKPAQIKPLPRQRKPQESTAMGYNQRISSSAQRQSSIQGKYPNKKITDSIQTAEIGSGRGVGGHTIATGTETVMFNGKKINVGGLREGQLFDENLQPILSVGLESSKAVDLKASVVPQNIKPARTIVRNQPQSSIIPKDKLKLRVPASSPVIISDQSILRTGSANQFNLNNQAISGVSGVPSAVQIVPGFGQRLPQGNVSPIYNQGIRTSVQRQSSIQRNYASTRRTGSSDEASRVTEGIVRSQNAANIRQQMTALNSGTVVFNGKEIDIRGLKEGQLFDDNLQPILPGGQVISSSQTSSISGQGFLSANKLAISPGVSRTTSGARLSTSQGSQRRSHTMGGTRTSELRRNQNISPSNTLRSGLLSSQAGISKDTLSETGNIDSLAPGTVLFNGKEINIDGLKEGQLFDENLQPILPTNSGLSPDNGVLSEIVGLRSSSPTGVSQEPQLRRPGAPISRVSSLQRSQSSAGILRNSAAGIGSRGVTTISRQAGTISATDSNTRSVGTGDRLQFPEGILPLSEGIQTDTSGVGLRNTALPQRSSATGSRSGVSSIRGAGLGRPSRQGAVAFDNLGYIDVTRSRGSDISPSTPSIENPITASLYGYRGTGSRSRISQDRISQDRVEASVTQQKQETPFLNTPDVQQRIQESDPSTKTISLKAPVDPVRLSSQKALQTTGSKQTQLKIEDVLQQSSLSKPEALRTVQVQETVPFVVQEPSSPGDVSKKTFTKITQVSQKNIDIPTVQQKLLGGGYTDYLPKTSFLSPFNYAPPQLSTSKYGVKSSPIVQEQQKLEQVFV